ncbi:MAG TPA: hypothetical protein PLZ57_12485 [Pseudobdellovibrionaceae bacterium]|nr:hypothetical protein [Pseudobdellovibrionaceae bacterium]
MTNSSQRQSTPFARSQTRAKWAWVVFVLCGTALILCEYFTSSGEENRWGQFLFQLFLLIGLVAFTRFAFAVTAKNSMRHNVFVAIFLFIIGVVYYGNVSVKLSSYQQTQGLPIQTWGAIIGLVPLLVWVIAILGSKTARPAAQHGIAAEITEDLRKEKLRRIRSLTSDILSGHADCRSRLNEWPDPHGPFLPGEEDLRHILDHFVTDADIRSRDPGYAKWQEGEVKAKLKVFFTQNGEGTGEPRDT